MANVVEQDTPFVFVIPLPLVSRVIALAGAAFFFVIDVFLLCLAFLEDSFVASPDYLAIVLVIVCGISFFLWLAFPSRASLSKLEVRRSGIRFLPNRLQRLIGEKPIGGSIPSQAKEILLCQSFFQELHDGRRLIICGPGTAEHEISANPLCSLGVLTLQKLAGDISAVTGLPVRFVRRRRMENGTVQEEPWMLQSTGAGWHGIAALVVAILPYAGGFAVGKLMPNPAVIVLAGLALWFVLMLAAFALARTGPVKKKFPTLYSLTTLVSFAAGYALSVVLAIYVF
jgi:hypothetical protein